MRKLQNRLTFCWFSGGPPASKWPVSAAAPGRALPESGWAYGTEPQTCQDAQPGVSVRTQSTSFKRVVKRKDISEFISFITSLLSLKILLFIILIDILGFLRCLQKLIVWHAEVISNFYSHQIISDDSNVLDQAPGMMCVGCGQQAAGSEPLPPWFPGRSAARWGTAPHPARPAWIPVRRIDHTRGRTPWAWQLHPRTQRAPPVAGPGESLAGWWASGCFGFLTRRTQSGLWTQTEKQDILMPWWAIAILKYGIGASG